MVRLFVLVVKAFNRVYKPVVLALVIEEFICAPRTVDEISA